MLKHKTFASLSRPYASLSLLVVLAAALALAACGSSSSTSSSATSGSTSPGTTITLYNGQHEQTTAKLVAGFEKQTGIKVKVRSDDEDVLGNQIIQEGSSSPADVFYTENTPVLEDLQEKGLLSPISASTLAAVPSKYSSPQGDWVGVSARVSVLVYNTSQIKASELPSSILELAQPKWKGKVGFAPSETDFQPLVTAITKLDGVAAAEKWLKGLQANAKVYPDNETVVAQVNNGESTVGIINHYYWYRLRDEVGQSHVHSALHYYAPHDPGYLLNVSGAAVLKSSKQQAAAQKFVAFLVGKAGQEILAHSHSYEYPIGSGVLTAQPLKPFDQLQLAPVTIGDLGNGHAPLELEQKLGLL
jgi:iron(III) transport system substrate-binding protein